MQQSPPLGFWDRCANVFLRLAGREPRKALAYARIRRERDEPRFPPRR